MQLFKKKIGHGKNTALQAKEYRHFHALRFINILLLGFFALVVMGISLFLYQKIYTGIRQIQTIIISQAQIGGETIDFVRLEKVEQAWQYKHNTSTPIILRNPLLDLPIEIIEVIEPAEEPLP